MSLLHRLTGAETHSLAVHLPLGDYLTTGLMTACTKPEKALVINSIKTLLPHRVHILRAEW